MRSVSSHSTSGRRSAAGVVSEHLQRGLDRRRAGGDEHRRVDLLQRRVDLRARVGLVVHPAHLVPDDVRGDADAAGAADVQAARVDVVVAGQDREAVDQLQLVGVGLLDGLDAVDLGQLGQQVGRHVDRRAAGDVVEHDRGVAGGLGDLAEVGEDAAPVGLVVVRRDGQHRVHPGLDGLLGQVDRVARVVGPRAADDDALVPELADDQRDEPEVLLVGHRRRLARRAGHHQPVRAVREQVPADGDGALLVDGAVGTEGRDHGREKAFVGTHGD